MKKFFLLTMLAVFALSAGAANPPQGIRDTEYHYYVNENTYANTMTYTCKILLDGTEPGADFEVGVFCGDECRGHGIATADYYVYLNYYTVFMTIYGDDGNQINGFKLYDHNTETELGVTCTNTPITFVSNQTTDMMDPYVFNFASVRTITAVANPTAGGTVTIAGGLDADHPNSFSPGTQCTLTATANTGYQFEKWTLNGTQVSTASPYTFTVTTDADYVANFKQVFTINAYGLADYGDNSTFTVNGQAQFTQTVLEGNSVTLTTANTNPDGFSFAFWGTENGEMLSEGEGSDLHYTFTPTASTTIVAYYNTQIYMLTVACNPNDAGNVTVAGGIDGGYGFIGGTQCTITATPTGSWNFANWSDNDVVINAPNPYTFTVTESHNFVANFTAPQGPFTITATTADAGGTGLVNGVVTYTDTHMAGEQCTLDATSTKPLGYIFSMWVNEDTGDLIEVNPYTFTVTGNANYTALFTHEEHMISTTSNPTEGGTIAIAGGIAGDGTYGFLNGDTCTLTATANATYSFVNWTENGLELSTENPYSFPVFEGRDIVANFSQQNFTITAVCDPTQAGTITGAGSLPAGSTCTLTVTPNPGYTFEGWYNDDMGADPVSTELTYSFTVTGDANYVAVFSYYVYVITVTAVPSEGGTVTGGNGYHYGQTCTLTATPAEGYSFIGWWLNGSQVSAENPYSFTVTESADYEAHFNLDVLPVYNITVSANPVEGGTVTGDGSYEQGATCTVEATANPGYEFVNWTVDGIVVATTATHEFTVTGDAEYVANFNFAGFIINATAMPTEGGNVTISGGIDDTNVFLPGSSCTLEATANEGYTFLYWALDGEEVSNNASYTFTVNASADYVAVFTVEVTYSITAYALPVEGGLINGEAYSQETPYVASYVEGTACTLTATANEGYNFVNWTKDGEQVSAELTYTFEVTEDAVIVANFNEIEYIIDVDLIIDVDNGNVIVEGNPDGIYHYGDQITLTAVPDPGFYFVGWSTDDNIANIVSTDNPWTFTVTGPFHYEPIFLEHNTYMISVIANPITGGDVTGGGIYHENDVVTLSATVNPGSGFQFVNWTLNGVEVSTSTSFDITVSDNAVYVANFTQNVYYVTVRVQPNDDYGYVYGVIPGGYYIEGHTCSLTAIPNPGYSFDRWTQDGVTVSYDEHYTFNVYYNTTMVAHFTRDTYTISAYADPYAGGNITGTGSSFHYGDNCTLTATANNGYTFENWTLNGEVVSTTPSFSFTVEDNASYVAHFTQNLYTINLVCNPEDVAYLYIVNGGNNQFEYGHSCTLKIARIQDGYHFVSWTKNGNVVSTNQTYTFNVTEDATYVANFDIEVLHITTTAIPSIGGTVSGAGDYNYGESCTLTATPRAGYTFLRWSKNGATVSTDATYTFTVTESANYVAQFTTRAINIDATATEGGEALGGGLYEYGETVVLTAIADEDYVFEGWVEAGAVVSTEAEYIFVAEKDRVLVATFRYLTGVEENSYSIEMFPNPVVSNLTITTDMNDYQLDIFTITGAQVRSLNNCGNITVINVEDLSNGTYIIRLTKDNAVETRRFVKE